jgi:hypothetical protein
MFTLATLLLAGCATQGGDEPDGDATAVAAISVSVTTRPITLRTAVAGQYVTAENGGGGAVNANRAVAQSWETFTLYDLNGGTLQSGDLVNLGSAKGYYVCAENGGGAGSVVNATRNDAQDWETFRVIKIGGTGTAINDGDQIALQTTVAGTYMSAINGGGAGVVADRTAISGWEAFVVGGNAPGWRLVWSDEFSGAAGTTVDGSKWGFDTGGGGWGNAELQNYTSRTDNVRHNGAG